MKTETHRVAGLLQKSGDFAGAVLLEVYKTVTANQFVVLPVDCKLYVENESYDLECLTQWIEINKNIHVDLIENPEKFGAVEARFHAEITNTG